jgi:transcriptional regulator with XRE-family HTH domain
MLMEKRKSFAERLRRQRDLAGLSQYRLGQLTGITKQSLSRLELGNSQPSWETVQLLVAALRCDFRAFADPYLARLAPPPPVKGRGRPRKGSKVLAKKN